MKKKLLITLSLMVMIVTTIFAQETHQAKVNGVVNIGKKDIASISDLETGILYKTSAYSKGTLLANQDVQLEFSTTPNNKNIRVLHNSFENIFVYEVLNSKKNNEPFNQNNALSFDGVDDYLETSVPILDQIADGDFTFETWVNAIEAENGSHPVIISNRPQGQISEGEVFFFHNVWGISSVKMLSVRLGNSNYFIENNGTYNGSLLDGNCHHVAVTRQGSLLSFYADGVLFGTRIISGNPSIASGENLRIGHDRAGGFPYKGTMSDLRIWKVARTNFEIALNRNLNLAGNEPNLIANWEMNEGEGQIVIDKVSGVNMQLGSSNASDNNDPIWSAEPCKEVENLEPTFRVRPLLSLKHREYSEPGVRSGCDFPRGTCLVIAIGRKFDATSISVNKEKPLKPDQGTAEMKILELNQQSLNLLNQQSKLSKDKSDNNLIYTGKLSFIYNQPTALDNGTNPVLEDVILNYSLSKPLGFDEITILANDYVVDFTNFVYGEIVYDFIATGKLKAKIRTNIPSNSSSNSLSDCNVCPQNFQIVNSESANIATKNFGIADISVVGNKLHLIFDQETANQNNEINISEDFSIGKEASEFLLFHDIIISKGSYVVDFSNYQFGEVFIDIKSVN